MDADRERNGPSTPPVKPPEVRPRMDANRDRTPPKSDRSVPINPPPPILPECPACHVLLVAGDSFFQCPKCHKQWGRNGKPLFDSKLPAVETTAPPKPRPPYVRRHHWHPNWVVYGVPYVYYVPVYVPVPGNDDEEYYDPPVPRTAADDPTLEGKWGKPDRNGTYHCLNRGCRTETLYFRGGAQFYCPRCGRYYWVDNENLLHPHGKKDAKFRKAWDGPDHAWHPQGQARISGGNAGANGAGGTWDDDSRWNGDEYDSLMYEGS
jgi:hypothetical protein